MNRTPERMEIQVTLIASYGALGRLAEARAEFEKYKRIPGSGLRPQVYIEFRMPFSNPQDAQPMIDDLDKAGLPD